MKMIISLMLAIMLSLAVSMGALASGRAVMIIPVGGTAAAADTAADDTSTVMASAPAADGTSAAAASATTAETADVEQIAVPADAAVLITLEGTASGSCGTLSVYTRPDADTLWTRSLTTAASYGSAGLYKSAEGDLRTPVGIFRMNTPFGIKAPLEGFPEEYITVSDTLYWVGDQSSPLYNKLADTARYSDFDRTGSEHLIDYAGYYDYCLDTGYNIDGTPGAGSAIFLHCTPDGASTHGCIAIPESDMIEILRLYQKDRTYIAIYDTSDPAAVYTP